MANSLERGTTKSNALNGVSPHSSRSSGSRAARRAPESKVGRVSKLLAQLDGPVSHPSRCSSTRLAPTHRHVCSRLGDCISQLSPASHGCRLRNGRRDRTTGQVEGVQEYEGLITLTLLYIVSYPSPLSVDGRPKTPRPLAMTPR